MKVSGDLGKISISFDEATLVPSAGLIAPAAFMQRLGLGDLFTERLRLDEHGANSDIKALTVIGSMLAGGDSIDDTDLMRVGANEQLLGEVRAPSTIGTWLRAWRWHNVRESETVSRVLDAGATGQLTMRADSAFYSGAMLNKAKQLNIRFSITVRQDKKIARAIDAIPEADWRQIPYWSSTDDSSAADVAETSYTCFEGSKHPVEVRLVVRRVRPDPGSKLALFTDWAYHGFVTDRDLDLIEVEADHRRHAVVEQTIAELKSAGLAHFPSGLFAANAAWLALPCLAHNLGRGIAILAGPIMARATAATLRNRLFTIPGRVIRGGRQLRLRLPKDWPWAEAFHRAMAAITALPATPT